MLNLKERREKERIRRILNLTKEEVDELFKELKEEQQKYEMGYYDDVYDYDTTIENILRNYGST